MIALLSEKRLTMVLVPVLLLFGLAVDNSFGFPPGLRVWALLILGGILLILARIGLTMEETFHFDAERQVLSLFLDVYGRRWCLFEVGYEQILCLSVQGKVMPGRRLGQRREAFRWFHWNWTYWPVAVLADGRLIVLAEGGEGLTPMNELTAKIAGQSGFPFTPGQFRSQGYVTYGPKGDQIFLPTELTLFDLLLQQGLFCILLGLNLFGTVLLFHPDEWWHLVFWR